MQIPRKFTIFRVAVHRKMPFMENLLKSAYGTVRPYTRHATGCTNQSDDNSCLCPKWLYVFSLATKEKRRYTLNTASWAEALREASAALRGLDPEIAALRAKAQGTHSPLSVREAMHLWVARTENKLGKDASTIVQYRHLEELVSGWAREHGIKYAKDITSYQLESWYASPEWTRLAPTTRKQRWAVLRVMFAHMVKVKAISESPADPIEAAHVTSDHVQGPYTDTQVKAILAHVESVPPSVTDRAYVTRLRAFIRLLLDSGCDVSDALQFGQHQIEKVRIEKRDVWVFRYKRQKTKQQAVTPISAELAKMLRHLPLESGVSQDAPFRIRGISLKAAQNRWSRRVQYAISAAKVTHVDLPDGRKKSANVKQLRHTAAVRWLRQGQRVEEVARMLGHTDAEMVRRHYAPWVRDLDVAHVSRVVSQWK